MTAVPRGAVWRVGMNAIEVRESSKEAVR